MKKSILRNLVSAVIFTSLLVGSVSGCSSSGSKNPVENRPTQQQNSTGSDTSRQESSNDLTNVADKGGTVTPDNPADTPKPPQAKDVKVKALYLTGWTVGSMKKVQHYIDLAKTTEINSYVVDIKDDDGYVGYESEIPAVRDIKAWEKKYNVDKVLKAFHDNGVHVIGRIVCFKDPVLSSKRPDLAIKNVNGGLWRDKNKMTWLDPYNTESWPYLIEIAKEAVKKGFDEIQFDYVRFANDGNKKAMYFGNTEKEKYEAINEFLAYARKQLPGVVLSADVFGIICESPADREGIGQHLEYVGKDIDYISPMAYPSHYALGQSVNGVKFAKPDFKPYEVVYNTLAKAKNRISKVDGYKANVRPYLQDFTATWIGKGNYQKYGPEQVRQQIKAVYDAGYEEWIFWDANNTYSEAGFLKESK